MNERSGSASDGLAQGRHRRRRSSRGYRRGGILTWATAALLGVVLLGAPLAMGAVHRPVLLAVMAVVVLAAGAATWLAARSGQNFQPHLPLLVPLCFVAIAAVQSVPLPSGVRARLDPAGSELLAFGQPKAVAALSLDPPATHTELAKAGAVACVAFAALVLSAGRRLRLAVPFLVATAGVAVLIVGLGHRAAFETRVYGLIAPGGEGLPVGPFINRNHEAELLELSAFVALALAYAGTTRDKRLIWKLVAAVLMAGALSTLSRGSVLALGVGAITWLVLRPATDDSEPRPRSRFVAALVGLLVVGGITVALGGDRVLGRVWATHAANAEKIQVWKDALKMIPAHPMGIGLGAFSRVYPAYQTVSRVSWFEFLENQPLGILIEAGIPGALLVVVALVLTARRLGKRARRDKIEASLLAGLAAVLAHNLVDFGLEVPGILLPFAAVLGAVFGRQISASEAAPRSRANTIYAALAGSSALAGIVLLLMPSARDFDSLLAKPHTIEITRAAVDAHPTDYSYVLAQAMAEPLLGPAKGSSPRLGLLNRAMILCPGCAGAHRAAARTLWRLGRRQQSIFEWKTAIALNGNVFWSALEDLGRGGAKPEEFAALASDETRFDLCRWLLGGGMVGTAKDTLLAAPDHQSVEFNLVRAGIALAENDIVQARESSQRALAAAPSDPRTALAAADVELKTGNEEAALGILRNGLRFVPASVDLNRKVLALLIQTDKWEAIDRAVDGLRAALVQHGAATTEVNIAAAQVFERRGQFRRAMSEYRTALLQSPDNIGLLLSLARVAEETGNTTAAKDAYEDVLRRAPGNADAQAALARFRHDRDQRFLEGMTARPALTNGNGK
ncbi:MAG: O-antigen ligase family protein [Polyangia bacterium]